MGQGYSRADYRQRTRVSASHKSSPNISESESESDGGRNIKQSVITNDRPVPTSLPRPGNAVPVFSPKRTQTPPSPHQIWVPPKETLARELQERQERQSSDDDDDSLIWLAGLTATPDQRSKESSRALGKDASAGKQQSNIRPHTRPSRRPERPSGRSPTSPAKGITPMEAADSRNKDITWAEMDARESEFRKLELALTDQKYLIEEHRRLEEAERRFEETEEDRRLLMRKQRLEEGLWGARVRQARQLRKEAQTRVEEAITQEARTDGHTRRLVLVENVETEIAPPEYRMNLVEEQIDPGDRNETQEQTNLGLERMPKDKEPRRQQHTGSEEARVDKETELRAKKARHEKLLRRMSKYRSGAYRRAKQRRQEKEEVKKTGKLWEPNNDRGHELGWDGEEWCGSQSDTDGDVLGDEESSQSSPFAPSRPELTSAIDVQDVSPSSPPTSSDIDAQLGRKSEPPSGSIATNCDVQQGTGKGSEKGDTHDTKCLLKFQEKQVGGTDTKDRQFPLELPREKNRGDGSEGEQELFERERESRNVTIGDSIENDIPLASTLPTPASYGYEDPPCDLGQKLELRRVHHFGSREIYIEGTNEGAPEVSNPLKAVAPEILSELAHLDLSHTVTFKDSRVVGGGTYGDVSTGSCDVSGRGQVKIAIKRLRFWLQRDIKTLFEQEIYVWAKLRHPNILPFLGYAIDDTSGYPLLISEWMENGSAWEYVIRHPSCNVSNLLIGIASGLAYLHSLGVVHSDIKSDNIMVSDIGNALICDFGCSRLVDSSRTYARLTSSVKGTTRYLAYELVMPLGTTDGFSVSHTLKTDVWAFGMTIFELITYQRPYANLLDTQVVVAISTRVLPQFPATVPSNISHSALDRIKVICNDCWKHDPPQRPAMQSVLAELKRIRDMSVTPVST